MSSLRQLAKELNISPAMVSAALRGLPSVKRETRERIVNLARQKGYHFNPLASAVMGAIRRSHVGVFRGVVGLLRPRSQAAPLAASARWTAVAAGARQAAGEAGYTVDEIASGEPDDIERIPGILQARGISGLLIATEANPLLIHALHKAKVRMVHTEPQDEGAVSDAVVPDYFQGLALAMNRFKALGHVNPGLVLGPQIAGSALTRCRCFYAGLQAAAGHSAALPLVLEPDTPRKTVDAWMDAGRHDAILCTDPVLVEDRCPSLGGRVFAIGADASDPYGGVVLPFQEVGRRAIELLCRRMVDTPPSLESSPVHVLVRCTWHSPRATFASSAPGGRGEALATGR